MDARRVTDRISVAPQITAADVNEVAAQGFRSIVCNRPDGESADQTAYNDIEAAAKAAGLEIVWQPVISGSVQDQDGKRFGDIVAGLEGPVLAYCRTGTRCIVLWALSEATSRSSDEIVRMAAQAGYDLRGLTPRLDAIRAQGA